MSENPAEASVTIGDRFVLLGVLGSGGMGTVWRARDSTLGREVALKELNLPPGLGDDERAQACARAVREAQIAARLRHPGIVVVHDAFVHDDRPWIVMQLLRGQSLDAALKAGPLAPRRAAMLGLELLDALSAAHGAGVLHRDIKPGNVFLVCDDGSDARVDGRAVLTDFGIASVEGQAAITRSGLLVGSPGWMAPERLRGEVPGPQADLWSMAATLYQAVEGVSPHDRPEYLSVLTSVLTDPPRTPVRVGELGPLLLAMLAKDPRVRPAPGVVRQVLESVARGGPTEALTMPRLTPVPGPAAVPPGWPAPSGSAAVPPGWPAPSGRSTTPVTAVVLVLAALVALVALSGIGAAAVFLRGSSRAPSAATSAMPSDTPSAAADAPTNRPLESVGAGVGVSPTRDAKFTERFNACDLVTVAQVRQLIPQYSGARGVEGGSPHQPECAWDAPGAGFEVALGDPLQLINATAAHDSFLASMRGHTASDKVIWHYDGIGGEPITSGPGTAAEMLPGVGEEAFVTDLYGRRGAQDTEVTFRISNLIVHVIHADVTGNASRTTIRNHTVQMARWTADALKKRETS